MSIRALIAELDASMSRQGATRAADARRVRRAVSRRLRGAPASLVFALAQRLTTRDTGFDRFFAYELIASHPAARDAVRAATLRRLGRGMDSWGDVDTFACYVAGPTWREGHVSDAEISRWLRSSDRWWRRAAVVSTVALNNRARGGTGDPRRTLALCRQALGDRDPMVIKALSWALRELAKRAPRDVEQFLHRNVARLPSLVRREVKNKLTTGLKTPRRVRSVRSSVRDMSTATSTSAVSSLSGDRRLVDGR